MPQTVCDLLYNKLLLKKTLIDFIYDPDQDPEEKRTVRKNYRSLAKTVEGASFLSQRHLYLYANMGF